MSAQASKICGPQLRNLGWRQPLAVEKCAVCLVEWRDMAYSLGGGPGPLCLVQKLAARACRARRKRRHVAPCRCCSPCLHLSAVYSYCWHAALIIAAVAAAEAQTVGVPPNPSGVQRRQIRCRQPVVPLLHYLLQGAPSPKAAGSDGALARPSSLGRRSAGLAHVLGSFHRSQRCQRRLQRRRCCCPRPQRLRAGASAALCCLQRSAMSRRFVAW